MKQEYIDKITEKYLEIMKNDPEISRLTRELKELYIKGNFTKRERNFLNRFPEYSNTIQCNAYLYPRNEINSTFIRNNFLYLDFSKEKNGVTEILTSEIGKDFTNKFNELKELLKKYETEYEKIIEVVGDLKLTEVKELGFIKLYEWLRKKTEGESAEENSKDD